MAKAKTIMMHRGKGKTAKVIALLTKRPCTVKEISKALGISTVHTRSVIFSLGERVQAERTLTRYSIKR
jgi:hypothetical protein